MSLPVHMSASVRNRYEPHPTSKTFWNGRLVLDICKRAIYESAAPIMVLSIASFCSHFIFPFVKIPLICTLGAVLLTNVALEVGKLCCEPQILHLTFWMCKIEHYLPRLQLVAVAVAVVLYPFAQLIALSVAIGSGAYIAFLHNARNIRMPDTIESSPRDDDSSGPQRNSRGF